MWQSFRKNKLVKFLASLKLAVCVIVSFTVLMIWGTLTESHYNTIYAKWQVYLSWPFIAVEILLFINILFAALMRLPYKKKLSGFYMIHAGLLTLLVGAGMTAVYGLDGNIRLLPKQPSNAVVINEPTFYAFYNQHGAKQPVEFFEALPKVVKEYNKKDKPFIQILDYDLYLNRFLPFASPKFSWRAHKDKTKKSRVVALRLSNAMFTKNVKLSSLDSKSASQKMGPLTLMLMQNVNSACFEKAIKNKSAKYLFQTQDNCVVLESIPETVQAKLFALEPLKKGPHVVFFGDTKMGFGKDSDWKFIDFEVNKDEPLPWMGFKLTVTRLIDDKYQHIEWYADPPRGNESKRHFAAQVTLKNRYKNDDTQTFWIDDTALKKMRTKSGFHLDFMIGNKLHHLPFMLELDRFKMDNNPGTNDPASYESFVKVKDIMAVEEAHVYMNNPLTKDKFTFYQASYFALENGKGYGSVLSVNHDPGRATKYAGSILLVLGSIIHFTIRSLNGRKK